MSLSYKTSFFDEIKRFVSLQITLLEQCLGGMEFSIFSKIPPTIHVEGESWTCRKHGFGIEFSGTKTCRIVDVHRWDRSGGCQKPEKSLRGCLAAFPGIYAAIWVVVDTALRS
jgi:hypothetical protein